MWNGLHNRSRRTTICCSYKFGRYWRTRKWDGQGDSQQLAIFWAIRSSTAIRFSIGRCLYASTSHLPEKTLRCKSANIPSRKPPDKEVDLTSIHISDLRRLFSVGPPLGFFIYISAPAVRRREKEPNRKGILIAHEMFLQRLQNP